MLIDADGQATRVGVRIEEEGGKRVKKFAIPRRQGAQSNGTTSQRKIR
jgi:hypothetical protein